MNVPALQRLLAELRHALAHEGALRAAGVELFVLATLVAAGLLLPRPIPENGTNRPEIRSGSGLS